MRALIIFFACLLTPNVLASTTLPDISPNQPFCAQNRGLWIMLYKRADAKDPTIYMNLQVALKGEVFRAGMLCDLRPGEKLHCAVECDGGQAEIFPNGGRATHLFFVNRGIYVSGACDPVDKPILWQPVAPDEGIYDLEQTPCPDKAD